MKFSTLLIAFNAVKATEEDQQREGNEDLTLKEIILKPSGKRNAIGLERFGINMGRETFTPNCRTYKIRQRPYGGNCFCYLIFTFGKRQKY